jgi:hypothetical protein
MSVPTLANVDTTLTDTGIQRRFRSFLTSDRAAAGMQPKTSARGAACAGPSRASTACYRDR